MPDWEVWDRQRLGIARLVAEMKGEVIGWATLYPIPDWVTVSPITGKSDYIRVVETALYVASKARGKRIDFALLSQLVQEAEKYKFWTIQAHTFKANQPSIVLHQKCGLQQVGYHEKLCEYQGIWHNVILLERCRGRLTKGKYSTLRFYYLL